MTVYALIISKGSWDDYASWVDSIYLSPTEVDEAKNKFIARVKEVLATTDPIDTPKDEDGDPDYNQLSEADMEKHMDWYSAYHEAQGINIGDIHVKEYEIGKSYSNESLFSMFK